MRLSIGFRSKSDRRIRPKLNGRSDEAKRALAGFFSPTGGGVKLTAQGVWSTDTRTETARVGRGWCGDANP